MSEENLNREERNFLTSVENQFPEEIVETGAPGLDMPPSTYKDPNDVAILHELWSSGMQPENRPVSFNDFLNEPFRFGWWPNGRLSYANLQYAGDGQGGGNADTPSGEFSIDILPDNFGDLTEVYYLDIGLGQPIQYLPESMCNMFQASKFELVERNGGMDNRILDQINTEPSLPGTPTDNIEFYNYCKDFYNSLIYYPDPNYDHDRLLQYHDECASGGHKSVGYVNLHLDSDPYLGPPGTLPECIGDWSHIEQIFWGIGMSDPNTYIPDTLHGWTKLRGLVQSTGGSFPAYNFPLSLCLHMHNNIVNQMNWVSTGANQDIYFQILYGPDWNNMTCVDYEPPVTPSGPNLNVIGGRERTTQQTTYRSGKPRKDNGLKQTQKSSSLPLEVQVSNIEATFLASLINDFPSPGTRGVFAPAGWEYVQSTLQGFIMWVADEMLGFTPRVGDAVGFFYTKTDGISGQPEDICIGIGEVKESLLYPDDPEYPSLIVLAMVGDDGSSYSDGYINPGASFYELGQIQGGHFKYYNSETGEIGEFINTSLCNYFDELVFYNNMVEFPGYYIGNPGSWTVDYSGTHTQELCGYGDGDPGGTTMTIDIPSWGSSLVSFPLTLADNSPAAIFGTSGPVDGLVGEGEAANLSPTIGWIGSLDEIDPYKGYWVSQPIEEGITIDISGEPLGNPTYELNPGTQPTLISYPFLHTQDTGCTLDGLENTITSIIGHGKSATYSADLETWIGNLELIEPGKGYWVRHASGGPTNFQWNQCSSTSSSTIEYYEFVLPSNLETIPIAEAFQQMENQLETYIYNMTGNNLSLPTRQRKIVQPINCDSVVHEECLPGYTFGEYENQCQCHISDVSKTYSIDINSNNINIDQQLQILLNKAIRDGIPTDKINASRTLLFSYIPEWITWTSSVGNGGNLESWMNQSPSDRIYCSGGGWSGCGGAGTCGNWCVNGSSSWRRSLDTYHYKVTLTFWF